MEIFPNHTKRYAQEYVLHLYRLLVLFEMPHWKKKEIQLDVNREKESILSLSFQTSRRYSYVHDRYVNVDNPLVYAEVW